MMKIGIMFLLLVFCSPVLNAKESNFKVTLRNLVEKTFGIQSANKLFGEKEIELPLIPKIIRDAKSKTFFNKKRKRITRKILQKEMVKYNNAFVVELYKVVLNRKINADELSKWTNVLDQGGTREGLYHGLVLNRAYAGLENLDASTNQKTIEFTQKFMQKYLAQSVSTDKLLKANFYTLKRIVVERFIEVIDALANQKGDELERWYALFSQNIAHDLPSVYKNKVRKMTSAQFHYKWAKAVPLAHIKSEVIIKLHKGFNFLQY